MSTGLAINNINIMVVIIVVEASESISNNISIGENGNTSNSSSDSTFLLPQIGYVAFYSVSMSSYPDCSGLIF